MLSKLVPLMDLWMIDILMVTRLCFELQKFHFHKKVGITHVCNKENEITFSFILQESLGFFLHIKRIQNGIRINV